MTKKTRRFRSGREVFAEYIPDYAKQREQLEGSSRRNPTQDAHETVERLLSTFKSKVASLTDSK